jgi:hypothetical protein
MTLLAQAVAQLELLSRRALAEGDRCTSEALRDAQMIVLGAFFQDEMRQTASLRDDTQTELTSPNGKLAAVFGDLWPTEIGTPLVPVRSESADRLPTDAVRSSTGR